MKDLVAKDVMSRPVRTVNDALDLRQAAAFLAEHGISGAPVVDRAGSLLGVVSLTDVARSLEGADAGLTVRQIMTPIANTVGEDTPVAELARVMTEDGVHRLVVTRREEPVGIVSSMDLLKLIAALA